MTIKQDVKSIVSNSISIPVTTAAVTLGVVADTSDVLLSGVKATPGVVGNVAMAIIDLGFGIAGAIQGKTVEESQKMAKEATFSGTIAEMRAQAVKAGHSSVSLFDE